MGILRGSASGMEIDVTIASKSSRTPHWLVVQCEAGSSPSCDAQRIDAVNIQGSRDVFIRYERDTAGITEDDAIAKVRVIKGDVHDPKDIIIQLGVTNGLLTLEVTALKKAIEIVLLQKNQLMRVVNQGSGDVVVEDNVLATMGPALSIATLGSGKTFATSTETIKVDTLTLSSKGSGLLQTTFSEIRVSKVRAEYYSSGDMTIFINADSDVDEFSIIAEGSGDACVNGMASVTVNQLEIEQISSGDVSIGPRGVCQSAKLSMEGSGELDVGGVQCDAVDVNLMSSGKVTVQATNSLAIEAYGSGQVKFTGAAPHAVASTGSRHLYPSSVMDSYQPVNCKWHKVPGIKAKYSGLSTGVLTSELDSAESSSSVAVHSDAVGIVWDGVSREKGNILPLAAIVFLVAFILRWFNNSRRRAREEQRQPLLGAQRRVYV